jgi:hypothetical protein
MNFGRFLADFFISGFGYSLYKKMVFFNVSKYATQFGQACICFLICVHVDEFKSSSKFLQIYLYVRLQSI